MSLFRCLSLVIYVILLEQALFAQLTVPRFESSECATQPPETEKNVSCGYLTVLENRSVRTGATIRLPIIILRSDSKNPKPDPVLRTLGGPGVSSLRMVRGRRSSPWLKDRDMIIYEQRGTKYAQPNLDCPEVDLANIASAKKGATHQEARRDELAAATRCHDRLTKSGIDLSAYNSAESAADIEDLRRVLKLDKINLYGVSYSARLMLDVMRYFPNGIRSAVLESTLPPETNYDEVGVDNIVRTLNEMFAGCRTDANCAGAYPNLQREFYDVVERLNTKPLVVTKKDSETNASFDVQLTGNDFVTWIVDYLFSNEPAATVDAPSLIHDAHAGSYAEQFKRDGGSRLSRSTNSLGMRYSVWCGEEIPFENMTKIKRQGRKHPGLIGYEVMSLPDICSVWKVKRARAIANQSVKSDIPTLVLGAQYDAYTDPRWGRKVADRLKNGFFIEVPWAGHGPGFSVPCVRAMITDFIDEPNVQPKPDCVEKTRSEFKFLIKN